MRPKPEGRWAAWRRRAGNAARMLVGAEPLAHPTQVRLRMCARARVCVEVLCCVA